MLEGISHIALWILTLGNLLLILTIVRHLSRLPFGKGSSLTGKPVPDVELESIAETVVRTRIGEGHRTAYLFMEEKCEPCRELATGLRSDIQLLTEAKVIVRVLMEGDTTAIRRFATEYGLPGSAVYPTSERIFDSFGVQGTPHMVLVDREDIVEVEGYPSTEGGPWKELLEQTDKPLGAPDQGGNRVEPRTG